jgi:hypothetical protein
MSADLLAADPAPTDLESVTSPEWLGAALGARIARVEVVSRGRSLASKLRIRVAWADPGCELPTELFLKGFFSAEEAGFAWVGEPEARFYRDIAPLLGARIPRCFYVGLDAGKRHGMLIQEDLEAQGCRFFTPLDATTADGVAAALEQFARVHADTWNLAGLRQHAFLDPIAERFLSYTPAAQLQQMLDGARGKALPDGLHRAERICAGVRSLFARLADGRPQCLAHGDAHLGNTYATRSGERGLLDWQIPQRAHWAWDVAYHVGSALSVADRRREERALLSFYLERLAAFGAPAPGWDEAWSHYRESFVYGFNLWAITQRIAEPIIVEYCTRLGTAAADHETFERLGV